MYSLIYFSKHERYICFMFYYWMDDLYNMYIIIELVEMLFFSIGHTVCIDL